MKEKSVKMNQMDEYILCDAEIAYVCYTQEPFLYYGELVGEVEKWEKI